MATHEQNCKALSRLEASHLQPPDDNGYECPEWGAAVEEDDDGWSCTSEDCNWSSYPEEDCYDED